MPGSSFGVKGDNVPGPTGVKARKYPNSKSNAEAAPHKQGSSNIDDPSDGDDEMHPTGGSRQSDSEDFHSQGSSKIAQPPQVTAEDLNIDDDVVAIFEGQDISEELLNRAKTVFESAVVAKINEKLEEYAEDVQDQIAEAQVAIAEEMSEQLDSYLNYVIENWMAENQLAVETGIKSEMSESFLQGLHDLMTSHYVNVPEGETDVLEELAARVEELEASLGEELERNIELNAMVDSYERDSVFAEAVEGLADTQVAKLAALSEAIAFEDADDFGEKIATLRESYFPSSQPRATRTSFEDEEPVDLNEETVVPANVAAYVNALDRSAKKS